MINKIQERYNKILKNYQKKYSFNSTVKEKFELFNNLFKNIIIKEINNELVTIDKRDEYDILRGILIMISGEYDKLTANKLEDKYKILFEHRDKVIKLLKAHNFKISKKEIKKDTREVFNIKPEYGYSVENPRYPLLEDNDYFF